jgi:predicted alpha/beta superfamily hydrolase
MYTFAKLALWNPAVRNYLSEAMKNIKTLIIIFLTMYGMKLSAQVTFIVQSLPAYTPSQDNLYIAGDFTGWQPGVAEYIMQKNVDGKWSITLPAQVAGTVINFKFTRGSWTTVEKGLSGEEISNRTFTYGSSSSTVDVMIFNWADGGSGSQSTAAANVKIMSTDFNMPQLNRTRRIWIYFPPDYETSGINYPVLYMHDGQNLFDASTAYAGEWEVDETLNNLSAQGKRVPIVIGIDNGSERLSEYTPWTNPDYGGGEGEKYMQFIVETLKPYIDQHYRTLPDRDNTGIMGSSLGGLISHYGAVKYQETFSKAGIFSPSYWFSDNVWTFTHDTGKQHEMRFFQLCGTNEGSSDVVSDMIRMNDSLVKIGFGQDNIFNKIVEGGQHNEKLWREAFGEAYLWLFDTFTSSIKEPAEKNTVICYPNPVNESVTFHTDRKIIFDTVQIFDLSGKQLKKILQPKDNKIDVHDLLPATYIIKCTSKPGVYEGKFIKK